MTAARGRAHRHRGRRVLPWALGMIVLSGCSATAGPPNQAASGAASGSTSPSVSVSVSASASASEVPVVTAPPMTTAPTSRWRPSQAATRPSSRTPSRTGPTTSTRAPGSDAGRPPAVAAAPTTGFRITAADGRRAQQQLAGMSVREQAALVLMPAASSVDATVTSVRYGGVILMGSNGVVDGTGGGTPAEVRDYVGDLQAQRPAAWGPMLVAVDQEYGDVARLVNGFTEFPGASEIASSGRDDAVSMTERAAAAAAQEMRAVGVGIDFAPDADVLPADGESAIGDRSYGTDPDTVASFVAAAVRGYQSGGVAATLKHFPGIGGLSSDTHEVLPTVQQSCAAWNTSARVPFAAGIDAGAALVMTGHVLFPAAGVSDEPTSLSPTAVDDVLRGKGSAGCTGLGYTGVSVSDSFEMAPVTEAFSAEEAAWRGLAAGQDLILLPASPARAIDGIAAAVQSGQLPASRLRDAAGRILTLQSATSNVVVPPLSVVGSPEHRALADAARG